MDPRQLEEICNTVLSVTEFRDYAPNGCQVTGQRSIQRVLGGVTASLALIEAAIDQEADAILVHHGYFWSKEPRTVVGHRYTRLSRLMSAGLSLFAYHLPLDAHPILGNNAQLASLFGWQEQGRFGEQRLGCYGLCTPVLPAALSEQITSVLGRVPLCFVPRPEHPIQRLAWCTGGAQDFFEEAIALGVDAFITGEVSEPQYHLSQETGVTFIAAGHHATERYGVQALGAYLQRHYAVTFSYHELDNPV